MEAEQSKALDLDLDFIGWIVASEDLASQLLLSSVASSVLQSKIELYRRHICMHVFLQVYVNFTDDRNVEVVWIPEVQLIGSQGQQMLLWSRHSCRFCHISAVPVFIRISEVPVLVVFRQFPFKWHFSGFLKSCFSVVLVLSYLGSSRFYSYF